MKTINKILITTLLVCFGLLAQAQINTKVSTNKTLANTKISSAFEPALISKTDPKTFQNKTVEDLKNVPVKEIKVPAEYFNRRSFKRWTITPKKPFSPARYHDVGIFYSGTFTSMWFRLQRQFIGREAKAFVGTIHLSVNKDKQYLITIKSHTKLKLDQYVNLGISPSVVYKMPRIDDYTLAMVFKATHSGYSSARISALHTEGESERYPNDLLISKIIIDEL